MRHFIVLFILACLAQSCTTRNPECVRAHKNIKKLHLNHWVGKTGDQKTNEPKD